MRYTANPDQPLRLIAGQAACGRLRGAGALRQETANTCDADPPALGIDRRAIVELVRQRDRQEIRSEIAYALLLLAFVVLSAADGSLLVAAPLVAAVALAYRNFHRDRYKIAPRFAPGTFEPEDIKAAAQEAASDIVVFKGHNPFAAFGGMSGSWVLSADAERDKDGERLNGASGGIDPTEIEQHIAASVERSGLLADRIKPLYFVEGSSVPEDMLVTPEGPPKNSAEQAVLARNTLDPYGPVRRYLWMQKSAWSEEVAISYFIRVLKDGGNVALELQGVVMPPIAHANRWVDRIPPKTFRTRFVSLLRAVPVGLWMLVWGPLMLFFRLNAAFGAIFANPERAQRNRARHDPNYDFGAPLPLRRRSADAEAMNFFQNMDRRIEETALTGRILRTFIDYLDDRDIDTSELREQRNVLMNQGIIIKGGDLKAENVAAGTGAKIMGALGGGQRSGGKAK